MVPICYCIDKESTTALTRKVLLHRQSKYYCIGKVNTTICDDIISPKQALFLLFFFLSLCSLKAGGDAPNSQKNERDTQYLSHIHRKSSLECHLNLLRIFDEETEGEDEGETETEI